MGIIFRIVAPVYQACPLCSSSEVHPLFIDKSVGFYQCARCLVHWAQAKGAPKPSSQAYSDAYYRQNYMPRLDLQRRFFAEELRRFRQFMKPGRVLDVGFGLGAFLQEAHLAGWKTEGIESSSAAYDYSKKALSSEVLLRLGDFARVNLVRDSYDLICFWDVLAHVEDPRAYLLKARSLLSANGIIVIKTPIRPTKR